MSESTCCVTGCERPVYVKLRGLCSTHYHRWRKTGDPTTPLQRQPNIGTCSVEGCGQPMRKRGWCAAHYQQQRRTGEPPRPFLYKWANESTCIVCGSTDMGRHRSRKFCSANCQMLESRSRREFPDAIRRSKPCARCGVTIDLFAPGVSDATRRPSNRKRRGDSALCSDCTRQRRYRHHWSVQALAARDGTDCRICDGSIDMALRSPHLLSPSVDHIVSRADGGTDDPSNLQLAHLSCNHRKSRRSGWTMT